MTVINPPGYLHNVATHTAQVDRIAAVASGMAADGAGLTWRPGVRGFGDLKVNQRGAGANMSVDVSAGLAFVKGSSNAFQGLYVVPNDGIVNVAITAAHATLPRRDLIVARVQDTFYAGSSNTGSIEVVTGTAAASPVDPATPASTLVLARVQVAAAATSITNAVITDLRRFTAALGATIVLPDAASRTAMSDVMPGQRVFQRDTNQEYVWSGSSWTGDSSQVIRAGVLAVNINASNDTTVTFSTPFPNACVGVSVVQHGTYNAPFGPIGPFMVRALSTTSFVVRAMAGNLNGVELSYVAVGY